MNGSDHAARGRSRSEDISELTIFDTSGLAYEFFAEAGLRRYALAFDNDARATHVVDLARDFDAILRARGICDKKMEGDE